MRYSVLSSFHMFDIFHSHVWGATGMEPRRAAPAGLRQPLAPVSTSSARPAAPRPQGWARAPPEVARGGRRGLRRLLGQHPGLKKRTSDGGQACPSACPGAASSPPGRGPQTLARGAAGRGRWPRGVRPPPDRALLTRTPATQDPGLPGLGLWHLSSRHRPGPSRAGRGGRGCPAASAARGAGAAAGSPRPRGACPVPAPQPRLERERRPRPRDVAPPPPTAAPLRCG